MKIRVELEMDPGPDDNGVHDVAVTFADRLEGIAERLRDEYYSGGAPVPVRDLNGNRIGEYEISGKELQ